jgi:hypothetical protein
MPDDDPSGVSPGSVGIGTQSLDRLNKARSAACTLTTWPMCRQRLAAAIWIVADSQLIRRDRSSSIERFAVATVATSLALGGCQMNHERQGEALEPQNVEVPPNKGELPEKQDLGKGGEDEHELTKPLPRGTFRPVTDPGEPTSVEEK